MGVWKFLRAWHFLSLPPLGVITPILPSHIMGLSTQTKKFLFWGNRFPFHWDMGFQSFKMLDFEHFRDSEAVYNEWAFTLSTAVTVRDRPQNYLESNRKPVSKSRFFGSTPYFYFLFGLRGPKNAILPVFFGRCGPQGGHSPKLATVLCRPLDPEHFNFYLVRIGLHLGEIWKFERDKISHFLDSLIFLDFLRRGSFGVWGVMDLIRLGAYYTPMYRDHFSFCFVEIGPAWLCWS